MIKVYGASVIGTSHIAADTPCHDSHYFQLLDNDLGVVAAISDGMGSAKYADVGSSLAANFVVDYLVENLEEKMEDEAIVELIKEAYEKTHNRLQEEADITEVDIKDLNATLLVFLSIKDRQFYGQVGDCTAVGLKDETYKVIVEQQRGEYANATFSICNLQSVKDGIYEKCDAFYEAVALMSDGVESMSISSKDNAVSQLFFAPFFKVFEHDTFNEKSITKSLERFLSSERINKKTDDDKTLLFIGFE